MWVACTLDNVVARLDPTTLAVTARVSTPPAPDGLATDGNGRIYVVAQQGPALAEGERLRRLPADLRQLIAAVEAEQQQGTLVNGAFEHLLQVRCRHLTHALDTARELDRLVLV